MHNIHHENREDEACLRLLAESNIGRKFCDAAAVRDVPWGTMILMSRINCVRRGLSVDAERVQSQQDEMCDKR